MNTHNPIKNQEVLVLGLGTSGHAAARLLAGLGNRVTVREDRQNDKTLARARDLDALQVRVEWGPAYPPSPRFDLAVLSPGIAPDAPLVRSPIEAGIQVISEIELAWRHFDGRTVAITGTNGKTTTTGLIEAMLQAAGTHAVACGNYGVPFSEVVAADEPPEVAVVEVSSFQLETIQHFCPEVGVYLNLTPDHLDRYPDMNAYRIAKERLFMNMGAGQTAVIQEGLRHPGGGYGVVTFTSAASGAPYTWTDGCLCEDGRALLAQEETELRGPHQAENQLAALAVGKLLRVSDEDRARALRGYRPLAHRCEVVAHANGVVFINDSKATNIDAMVRALEAYGPGIHLIAGGKDKGFDYATCAREVGRQCRAVYLIGEAAGAMHAAWAGGVNCRFCASLEEAVAAAQAAADPESAVLLSPGCSSFDMFEHYQERGDRFRQTVIRLLEAKPKMEKTYNE